MLGEADGASVLLGDPELPPQLTASSGSPQSNAIATP
jgi:hypothetical protein